MLIISLVVEVQSNGPFQHAGFHKAYVRSHRLGNRKVFYFFCHYGYVTKITSVKAGI